MSIAVAHLVRFIACFAAIASFTSSSIAFSSDLFPSPTEPVEISLFKNPKNSLSCRLSPTKTELVFRKESKGGEKTYFGVAAVTQLNQVIKKQKLAAKTKLKSLVTKKVISDLQLSKKTASLCNSASIPELLLARYKAKSKESAESCPSIIGFLPSGGETPSNSLTYPDDLVQSDSGVAAEFSHTGIYDYDPTLSGLAASFVFIDNNNDSQLILPHSIKEDKLILSSSSGDNITSGTVKFTVVTVKKVSAGLRTCSTNYSLSITESENTDPDSDPVPDPSLLPIPALSWLTPNYFVANSATKVTIHGKDFTAASKVFISFNGSLIEYPGVTVDSASKLSIIIPQFSTGATIQVYASNDGTSLSNALTLNILPTPSIEPPPPGTVLAEAYAAPAIIKGDHVASRNDPQYVTFGLPFPSKKYVLDNPDTTPLFANVESNLMPVYLEDELGNVLPFQSHITKMHLDGETVEWGAFTAYLGAQPANQSKTIKVISGGTGSWGGAPLSSETADSIQVNSGYYYAVFSKLPGEFNPLTALFRQSDLLTTKLGLELILNSSQLDIVTTEVAVIENGPVLTTLVIKFNVNQSTEVLFKGELLVTFTLDSPHIKTQTILFPEGQKHRALDSGTLFFEGMLGSNGTVKYPTTNNNGEISLPLSAGDSSLLRINGNTKPSGWQVSQEWNPVRAICTQSSCATKFNHQGMVVRWNGFDEFVDSSDQGTPLHVYGTFESNIGRVLVENRNGRVDWASGVGIKMSQSGETRIESHLYSSGYENPHLFAHNDAQLKEVTFSFLDSNFSAQSNLDIASNLDRPYYGVPTDIESLNYMSSFRNLFANNTTEAAVLNLLGISISFPKVGVPYSRDWFHYDSGNGGGENNQNSGMHDYMICVSERLMGHCEIMKRWINYRVKYRTLWKLGSAINPEVKAKYDIEELAHTYFDEQALFAYVQPDDPLVDRAMHRHREFLLHTFTGNQNKYTRPLSNALSATAAVSRYFNDLSLMDAAIPKWSNQLVYGSNDKFAGSNYGWYYSINETPDPINIGNTYLEPMGSPDCAGFSTQNPSLNVQCKYSGRGFMSGFMLGDALTSLNERYGNSTSIGIDAKKRSIQAADYMLYHGHNFDPINPANNLIGYLTINVGGPYIATYPSGADHPTTKSFATAFIETGDQKYLQALKMELEGFAARGHLDDVRYKAHYRTGIYNLWKNYFSLTQ